MNKNTVIYHSADYDGMFSREIARKFLPPDTEFIGWDFPDKPICLEGFYGTLYVLDLPCDKPFGFDFGKKLVYDSVTPESEPRIKKEWTAQMSILNLIASNRLFWIDHHKTSIDTHPPEIGGYRIDGVAACRLAWQWFTNVGPDNPESDPVLASKKDFVDRKVIEPLAVRLAGEYDIWDKRDPRADIFQFGLRSRELTESDWRQLISSERPKIEELERLIEVGHDKNLLEPDGTMAPPILHGLLKDGELLQKYQQKNDASTMGRSFLIEFEGLKFLTLNTPRCNSLSFAAKDVTETGHDALMGFYWNGKEWAVSLYHAKHNTSIDLSLIAVKYGGGGHRGACGFRVGNLPGISNLPFISA